MATRRIGILTGGGDVPGLNSVIKEVVYRGTENDCEIVGIRRGESVGDLLDAVAAKDANAALGLLPIVLQLPKTTAVSIVMALTSQTLALGYAEAVLASGGSQRALFGELMALLNDTGAFPGRPWGEAVTAWTKHAPRWSAADVDAALSALLAADAALK